MLEEQLTDLCVCARTDLDKEQQYFVYKMQKHAPFRNRTQPDTDLLAAELRASCPDYCTAERELAKLALSPRGSAQHCAAAAPVAASADASTAPLPSAAPAVSNTST